MDLRAWLTLIYCLGAVVYMIFAIWFCRKSKRDRDEPCEAHEKHYHITTTNGWEIGGLCQWCADKKNCPYRDHLDRRGHRITNCDLYVEKRK